MPSSRFHPALLPALLAVLLLALLRICPAQAHTSSAPSHDPRQLFQQALTAQRQGDLQTAARAYEQVLQLQPHLVAAEANLGTVLAGLGRYQDAIAHDRAALALAPGNTGLLLNLGLAYYKKNDFTHAAQQFRKVYEARPQDMRVAILLGDCDLHLQHAREAVALLQPFADQAGNPDLNWVLGQAFIQSGHLRNGVQRIVDVAKQRRSADAWAFAARTWLDLNDLSQARVCVNHALQLNPRLAGLHTLDGRLDAYEGNDTAAAAAFRQALAANPKDVEALIDLGTTLYAQHQMDEARANLEQALRLQPASALARYELARVEAAQGNTTDAIHHLEQVEQAQPDWLKPHIELAALYFRARRPHDGMRERTIVDRLSAEQQRRKAGAGNLSAAVPAP